MLQLYATWTIAGVITEVRELKSPKNKEWRGYIIKVATLGQAFEINCDSKQFNSVAAGQHLVFTGTFDEVKGDKGVFTKYILGEFAEPAIDTKAGAA